MPPKHGLVGDDDDGRILPRVEERKIDKEDAPPVWKALSLSPDFYEHCDARIEYYQHYLPTGEPIAGLKEKERIEAWHNASVLIKEIKLMENTARLIAQGIRDGSQSE